MVQNNNKTKVLMCLSGGVDSSVAAALLVKQGYDVTGAFMVNYDDGLQTTDYRLRSEDMVRSPWSVVRSQTSCWVPDYRDAVRVAAHLGIRIIKLDFTKEYREKVLDYMFREYELGRTPNPDVLCNTFIKFGSWLEYAKNNGYDYLATGHYARREPGIKNEELRMKNYRLLEAEDKNKDQTYFLHQLNQEQLSRVMFPIGDYLKSEIRKLATKFGLPTAEKEESMGICFVGEVPMDEFLMKRIKTEPGKIVDSKGLVVGEHKGLAFYTIGQRHVGGVESGKLKGESKGDTKPSYVVDKRLGTNELVVGYENDPLLFKKEIELSDLHWVAPPIQAGQAGREPKFPLKCMVRMRHRQPLQECRIMNEELRIKVQFEKPQKAVTPGQFAVFYKGGVCLGGGVIN